MNEWYSLLIQFGMFVVLATGAMICVAILIKRCIRKEKKKHIILSLIINTMLIGSLLVFVSSHGTYYKFNDWSIVGENIHAIEEKYGEFDLGVVTEDRAGTVAYYIYTDNGFIMPDYLDHYYYMEYDKQGTVYKVYDACQPGG